MARIDHGRLTLRNRLVAYAHGLIVYRDTSEARGQKFDYIVCVHKAVKPDEVPPFEDLVDERTTFVIIQNGVGNEDPFRKAYPNASIISCVTWVGGIQKTPGIISHWKFEDTQMGLFPNPRLDKDLEKARLDNFAHLLRNGGTILSVEDNVQVQRCEKCIGNAALNPITTLTMVDSHTWLDSSEEAIRTQKRLMREMIDVARRCGVPVAYELIDKLYDRITSMSPVFSSMYVDMKAGRPLEVEVILGTAMKKARMYDMDVPVLTAIYSLTLAVHQRLIHDIN